MDNKAWAQEVAKKIKEKELAVAKRNVGKVPYTAENGVFNDCSGKEIGWWTNGFWSQFIRSQQRNLRKSLMQL